MSSIESGTKISNRKIILEGKRHTDRRHTQGKQGNENVNAA